MGANMELQFHVGGIATRVNLWIEGVREALVECQRALAERHHRSFQGELMQIFERAAAEAGARPPC